MLTAPTPRAQSKGTAPRVAFAAGVAIALVMLMVLLPQAANARDAGQSLRTPVGTVMVAGHRGDQVAAPENTLPALQQAILGPADFVETDVQLTSDGVAVLFHDWRLDRTTNGTGPLWATDFASLRELDAGAWYDPQFAGLVVPTLAEFLDILAPSNKRALLELKGSFSPDEVKLVVDEIREAGLQRRVVLASFDLFTLRAAQSVAPQIQRAIITREVIGDPAVLAASCGATAIVTSGRFIVKNPEVVASAQSAGLAVLLYTLNSEKDWLKAQKLGVDAIITDQPAELMTWMSSPAPAVASGR